MPAGPLKKIPHRQFTLLGLFVVLLLSVTVTVSFLGQSQDLRSKAATIDPGSGSQQPTGQTSGWHLIFSDEFSGTTLDNTRWTPCYPYWDGQGCDHSNNELQWYQPANINVSDGILHLTGKKETKQASNGKTYNYTSGMIASSGKFNAKYYYAEMKAKIPQGKGYWPAFWALPDDGTWPPEIDIMENLGHQTHIAYMTYHWGTNSDQSDESQYNGPDFSSEFHTYAVDWEPDAIVWYIDGVEVKRYTNTANISNKPMYLLANLAIGGDWPGNPDNSTVFPQDFQIDYIRVWQKDGTTTPTTTAVPTPSFVTPTLYCLGTCPTSALPNPTATPTQIPGPSNSPQPTVVVSAAPTTVPCTNTTSRATVQNQNKGNHGLGWGKGGNKFWQLLFQILLQLIQQLLGGYPIGILPQPGQPGQQPPGQVPTPTLAPTPTLIPGEPTAPPCVPTPTAITIVPVTATPTQAGPTATSAPTEAPISNPPVTNPPPEPTLPASEDHREYMHGIDMVKLGGKDLLVFSSNNYPPTQPGGDWIDDVYYSWITPTDPNGSFSPKTLVSAPQGQEPASAAVNSAGRLAVTTEDAQFNSNLDQTFGIWDSNLNPLVAYGVKLMPPQGGHSGHIAASGDKFLVSFSDGWIDGGGVDNLGTGDDVFAKIISNDGTTGSMINTAVGTTNRDWWPIVAGSDTNWLQVWQRYGTAGTGGGTVLGAIINQTGAIVKQVTIYSNNKYYYHDVQYLPSLGLYLIVGSQNTTTNAGIAVLVDKNGTVVATKTGLPNTVREGQTVINSTGTVAAYPTEPTGAAILDITANSITLRKTVPLTWIWDYMGTDGVFVNANRVVFATESSKGIRFITADF